VRYALGDAPKTRVRVNFPATRSRAGALWLQSLGRSSARWCRISAWSSAGCMHSMRNSCLAMVCGVPTEIELPRFPKLIVAWTARTLSESNRKRGQNRFQLKPPGITSSDRSARRLARPFIW